MKKILFLILFLIPNLSFDSLESPTEIYKVWALDGGHEVFANPNAGIWIIDPYRFTTVPWTYIMDTYSTNIIAGYSINKLRSAYSGSAVRVRRASDNTETDIGFVGNIFDVASYSSFISATTGFVVTWYDQYTNTYDITNATAANQPELKTQNGKLSLVFDGTNDILISSAITTISQPISYYGLINQISWVSGMRLVSSSNATNTGPGLEQSTSSGLMRPRESATLGSDNSDLPLATWGLFYSSYRGASSSVLAFNNGSTTAGPTGTVGVTRIAIGARGNSTNFSNSAFIELIVYNAAENTAITTSQNSNYGIY